jgi:1-acyl-sn-glycerol-3-phosphate acyltransferase
MIYHICKFLVWILSILFYRHKVYGKEHVPAGGAMIASNHCSFLDPPLVGISCPGKTHFLARETLFHIPLFGWLLRQLNTHPVHRGKGNLSTLKMTMELVRSGKKVVIFPEGGRSVDGELHKGQLGVGMLVQRTRCRIVPVYTHGTFKAWNKKRKFPKPFAKTACVFGTPIEYNESQTEDKKGAQAEIVDKIMEKVVELRAWYLAGAKGSPP